MKIVTVGVRFLWLRAELQLILAHRFELLFVVVKYVVSPGFAFADGRSWAPFGSLGR